MEDFLAALSEIKERAERHPANPKEISWPINSVISNYFEK
jgi:hypothetical protein